MEYVKKFTNPEHEPGTSPAPPGQMKAVVWHGSKSIKVEHVDRPKIEKGSDVIVKVTASSISPGFCSQVCAGDIPGMQKGQILGREAVGIIDEVGSEIVKFHRGDRVVISFVIACGECSFCKRREFSACNRTNDSKEFADTYGGWAPAAMFGGSRLYGNVPGVQAEYVRVPFADANCYKIPNGVPDDKAVFVADTATTGLHATELGQVKQGDTVVIWGLGPVGLMTAKWAKMKGASRVIGVDLIHDRLRAAFDKCNLEVVDRTGLSSDEVCAKLLKELGQTGADVTIDACGSCASCGTGHGFKKKMEKAIGMEKESCDILKECLTVTRKFGNVAVIADYAGQVDHFPIGHVMMKHLTVRAGQTPVQHYMKQVMDAIEAGELDPSELITHHYSLNDAAEAYSHACKKEEGYLKVLIRPDQPSPAGYQQSGQHQQPVHERGQASQPQAPQPGYGEGRQHQQGFQQPVHGRDQPSQPGYGDGRQHQQGYGQHEQQQPSSYGTSRTQEPTGSYGTGRTQEPTYGTGQQQPSYGTGQHQSSTRSGGQQQQQPSQHSEGRYRGT